MRNVMLLAVLALTSMLVAGPAGAGDAPVDPDVPMTGLDLDVITVYPAVRAAPVVTS